jgi:TonB family protein
MGRRRGLAISKITCGISAHHYGTSAMNGNKKYACGHRAVIGFRAAVYLALTPIVGLPHAVADEVISAPQQQPALPPVKSSKPFYYPEKAKRIGLEGTVLIEFNIDAKGKPTNLSVLRADDPMLASATRELFAGTRFDVANDWAKSANYSWRYRIGIVFCIPPSGQVDTFAESTYPPMIISTNRIPGSPVRNPVSPGATGQCAKSR